jgi:hypothetical protein
MTETESCIWRGYNDIEEKFITREKKTVKVVIDKEEKKSNMEKTSANFVET